MARLRQAAVRIGDTLQALAARELGAAERWRELVTLNGLRPPYLIASVNPAERVAQVLLWGDWLSVPALAINDNAALGDAALGADVQVSDGDLVAAGGDLVITAGLDNFAQALRHRLFTPIDSYFPHPDYGCAITAMLGLGNGPVVALLCAALARQALLRDPRAAAISAAGAVAGEQLVIAVQAQPVNSETVTDLNVIFQLPTV
jgi:phage baseplate assembly protein W